MAESSVCFAPTCGHVAEGTVANCPNCGRKMRTSRFVRGSGWFLLVLGLALVIGIGVILANIAPLMLHPGETVGGTTFNGTAEQGEMALMLLGGAFAVGAVSTINGAYQIRTGRRNRALLFATLVVGALLLFAARRAKDMF